MRYAGFISTLLLSWAFSSGALAQSRDASFSSDGSTVVFVSAVEGVSEVFTMNPDGSGVQQITTLGVNCYYPFFSSDDKHIVFMSYPKNHATVCVMDSDGTNFQRLTDPEAENADPHWTPDGRIIFYSTRDGNDEIYLMNRNGTNWQRLTDHPASDQTPSVSPDGRHIIFVSDRDGNAELYLMDIDGKNPRRLTYDPRVDRVPSWSPDSRKIIWYVREPSVVAGSGQKSWNGAELYEIAIEGLERKQLTHNFYRDHGPVYAPDGTHILFTSGKTGRREVFKMDSDGQNIIQLTGLN